MKKLIIITGTTRGLGRALADICAGSEDNIILTVNRRSAEHKKSNITEINADLAEFSENAFESLYSKVRQALSESGIKETVFINNAFSIEPMGRPHELTDAAIRKNISINIANPLIIIKELIKIADGADVSLKIVNISSGAAKRPVDGWSLYCSAKAYNEMLMNCISQDYGGRIKAFNADPGVMDTGMQESIRDYYGDDPDNYFIKLKEQDMLTKAENTAQKIYNGYVT